MTTENTEQFIITTFKQSGGIDTVKLFLENNFSTYSAEVTAEVPEIDTEEGRKRIKALGIEINKKLAEVDAPMRDYLRDIKKQPKLIEAIAKENKDKFTQLRADILKPLEEAQAGQDQDLATLNEIPTICGQNDVTSQRLNEIIEWVESFDIESVWPELKKKFKVAHENALTTARVTLERVEEAERNAAELKRLQDEEKKRQEEEAARKAADEAVRQEQARNAARLTNAINARIKSELTVLPYQSCRNSSKWFEDKLSQLQAIIIDSDWSPLQEEAKKALEISIVNAKSGKELAIADEEKAQREADDKAENDRKAAEKLAQQAAEQAAEDERKRIEAEEVEQKRLAQQREADKAHRTKINRAALAAMIAIGVDEEQGKSVIRAVAKGEIPNMKIFY